MKYDRIAKQLIVIYRSYTDEDMFKAINLATKQYRIFVGLTEKECAYVVNKFMEYLIGK